MPKFIVKEVKEIIHEAEITAANSMSAIMLFKKQVQPITKSSEESHVTALVKEEEE